MKRLDFSILALGMLVVGFSGCVNSTPKIPEKINITQLQTSDNIVQIKKIATVKNGKLISADNTIVFDEYGDIIATWNIKNQSFYFLKTNDIGVYQLKNTKTKKVIKEFNSSTIQWFQDNDKVLFAVKSK